MLLLLVLIQACSATILVAHRGDKALLPEHTIPSYYQAMVENVDFVEPDLVLTVDKVLVCYHDITLKSGTNVAQIEDFAHMKVNRSVVLNGKLVTVTNDWFISDFTLEQLSRVTVVQKKVGVRPQFFNGIYQIPTFQQFLSMVDAFNANAANESRKQIGMMPELKHPSFHNNYLGLGNHGMETIFLKALGPHINDSSSQLVVQSFEPQTISYLHDTTNLTLLSLFDEKSNLTYLTYEGMKTVEAHYIGVWKEFLNTGIEVEVKAKNITVDWDLIDNLGGFVPPDKFVAYAHSLGIQVGIYTIYHSSENSTRSCSVKCSDETKEEELNFYLEMGVDAMFVEGICETIRIRDNFAMTKAVMSSANSVSLGWMLYAFLFVTVFI